MSISGEDKPGVTSSLTEILSKHNATILDIGQANIHQSLSLGILFRLDPSMQGNILKDLLFTSYELGVNAKFTPIKREEYEKKTKPLLDSIRDNAPRFIETIPSSSSSTTIKNE